MELVTCLESTNSEAIILSRRGQHSESSFSVCASLPLELNVFGGPARQVAVLGAIILCDLCKKRISPASELGGIVWEGGYLEIIHVLGSDNCGLLPCCVLI